MARVTLNDEETAKLKKLLRCIKEDDLPRLGKLVKHADNMDYMMRVVDGFAMVTGVSKKLIIWFVVMFTGIATLTGYLGDWIRHLLKV